MNLLDLYASVILDTSGYSEGLDEALGEANSFGDKLKSGLATVGKVGGIALTAAAAGVTALTKSSVENYAEYEQLIGGVETLFKDSAQIVEGYADRAYQTAGLSANQYMETVTSFSASLLQSLEGDTAKAADYADQAIIDMADNANKMGTSVESIQNAYQGFAKQNYTMLDNLKLGYGGTKEEMQRLLDDAEKISGIEFDISSFADITQAIHIMQEDMGIAGTTAAEASSTISGSFAAVKAQWDNLLTSLAGGWDVGVFVSNLVDAVATAAGNIIPVIGQALMGIGELVTALAPVIVGALPTLIQDVLPSLIDASMTLILAIVAELPNIIRALIEAAPTIIRSVADALIEAAPMLFTAAADIVMQLIAGFFDMLPEIKEIGIDLVEGVWEGISSMARWIRERVSDFFGGIVSSVKNLLGIHSPSTVFAEMGKNMALGVGEGWDKSFGNIKAGIEDGMSFETDYAVTATNNGTGTAGNVSFGTVNININGANYTDEQSLAQAIGYELQSMTERRLAVFA